MKKKKPEPNLPAVQPKLKPGFKAHGVIDPQEQAGLYEKAMGLRFNGKRSHEIGKAIGRTPQVVRRWFMTGGILHERYKIFVQNALNLVPGIEVKSVAERIKEEAPRSLDTITEIRDDKKVNPAVRFMSAKDVLDRAGYAPVQKSANIHYVEEMSAEELDKTFSLILNAAQKSTPSSGKA